LAPLVARVRALLPAKVAVWIGLAVGICVPYFALQHVGAPPLQGVPATALDRAVPFAPQWIYAYVSLGLLVPIGPLVAATRDELARYAIGLALLCVPCFAIFLLVPVAGPRPEPGAAPWLYDAIVLVDRPSNSMPSLHAGLTLYSLLYVHRVLGPHLGARARWGVAIAGAVWGAAILYSTLATKQHWLLDLPAGLLVAWAAHVLSWRRAP
jgi:membrane-associated phospholipid phosphatase